MRGTHSLTDGDSGCEETHPASDILTMSMLLTKTGKAGERLFALVELEMKIPLHNWKKGMECRRHIPLELWIYIFSVCPFRSHHTEEVSSREQACRREDNAGETFLEHNHLRQLGVGRWGGD